MGKKKRVAVLFGGPSNEYEISLRSTASVLEHLDPEKYEIFTVGITKEGRWYLYSGSVEQIADCTWDSTNKIKEAFFAPSASVGGLVVLSSEHNYTVIGIDVVFPVLHGFGGEDGRVQGLLELSGFPYVGSGVLASAMCMDKEAAHVMLERQGIRMADWIAVREDELDDRYEEIATAVEEKLGYPVFVKPANSGSTVGVSKAKNPNQLAKALAVAFLEDKKAIVERAIVGQEVECAVLGNNALIASPLGEIVAEDFYDYEAKYNNNTAKLLIPANLSPEVAKEVQTIAKKAYRAMECQGLARVDFFVVDGKTVVLNEINTMPGFTSISMYPKLMEQGEISYGELLDRLITLALERKEG